MTKQAIQEAWKEKESAKDTTSVLQALKTVLLGIERLERLLAINSIPTAIEPYPEQKVSLFAEAYHRLSPEEKSVVLARVKLEIEKRRLQVKSIVNDGNNIPT